MTPLLALLELTDYLGIAVIVILLYLRASSTSRAPHNLGRLERKLDALLKHHGINSESPAIVLPSGRSISIDVQDLARDPGQKIAAITLHREQNPGLGLAEAKAEIEAFVAGGK